MENKNTFNSQKPDHRNAPAGTDGGVDHTLTPGENPVPANDPNKNVEWNKNEKVSEDKKMYVGNQKSSDDDEDEDETGDQEAE